MIITNRKTLESIGPFESLEDAKLYLLKKYKKAVFNNIDGVEHVTVIEESYKNSSVGFSLPSYKETDKFIIRDITPP